MMTFKIAFDRRLEANSSKPFELVTDNRSVRRAEVAMLLQPLGPESHDRCKSLIRVCNKRANQFLCQLP